MLKGHLPRVMDHQNILVYKDKEEEESALACKRPERSASCVSKLWLSGAVNFDERFWLGGS